MALLCSKIMGSFNISLSNNPVFLGGHFTTVELLEAIGLRGFRCIHVLFVELTRCVCHVQFFWLTCTARYGLSSLKINSGGKKFEMVREQVGLRRARMFDLLLKVMLLLITCVIFIFVCRASPEIAVIRKFPCRKLKDCHRETL